MRNILTVILLTLFQLALFSQNPIIREEYFEQYNDQWEKVSIVEYAYNNGVLTNEKRLYYENGLQKWVPQSEKWFDEQGNEITTIQQFYQGDGLGFYRSETHRTFNAEGVEMKLENYVKENKNSERQLIFKTERENLDDCNYIVRQYNTEMLVFSGMVLYLHDENCLLASAVRTDRADYPIDRLISQVRITFKDMSDGGQRRIVERLTCPDSFGCEDWKIQEQKTYDQDGRLVFEEAGSVRDNFRRITSIQYESDQTIYTYENLIRTNNFTTQTLLSRDITTLDLSGNVLFRGRFEPLSFDETTYQYNDKGLLTQSLYIRTRKDSTGISTFRDTTDYQYQYFCDDLVLAQITDYGNFKTKTTYSYLHPANCGTFSGISSLKLYPNPAISFINVESDAFVNGTYSLDILDALGRQIQSTVNYRNSIQAINVEDLSNGTYFLNVRTDGGRMNYPFVIQK